MNEFEIIARFFKDAYPGSKGDLALGIGDDAAIINVPDDSELVLSMDTLVAGVHFFENALPEDIAIKSLAVSLSDIAAMGATPCWISLSLTLPEKDLAWLEAFSSSFNELAIKHSLVLIGGDLTKGPLSITVQVHGVNPKGKSLRRSGANPGDAIYVSGKLGAAAYALKSIEDSILYPTANEEEVQRLHRPEARIKTGITLRNIATSCIDVSDGLLADLGHILKASKVGADIELATIPYSDSLKKLDKDKAIELALTGGDDYELCFTLPSGMTDSVLNELESICPVYRIGTITSQESELSLMDDNDEPYDIQANAYRHFS
ncbi:MAG: thiamine-monophosphate kinase [marine bacterium B5-7]|nr:MAG: thiamine-monophosphate kinase [marine bacterium B5-7]